MKTEPESTATFSTLEQLVARNVEAVKRIEEAALNTRTSSDKFADHIAGFCGSIGFIYVHCLIFSSWLIWNSLAFLNRFDPSPFNILNLVVSLEVIFLSTFILISQNRQQRTFDQRNHLDLQINMLAEQENSQMLVMMKQLMDHLGLDCDNSEHAVLVQPTDPERMAEQITEIQDAIQPIVDEPAVG